MAAPSICQDTTSTRRISFCVNERTYSILSEMAKKREISVEKMVREDTELAALANKSLVPLTMPPEHYTAQNDSDTFYE